MKHPLTTSVNVNATSEERGFDICLSKLETTILTPSGDVLVCRGREFFRVHPGTMMTTSNASQNVVHPSQNLRQKRYCAVVSDDFCDDVCSNGVHNSHSQSQIKNGSAQNPRENGKNDNECTKENYGDLSAPPSFDYSNFEPILPMEDKPPRRPLSQVPEHSTDNHDTLTNFFGSMLVSPHGNDPEQHLQNSQQASTSQTAVGSPNVLHGVPTCLMREIRIAAISANPMGSHVLLISTHALLFSYGANNHGQLGLGTPESFVSTPTLVTAVLEGGGKTVHCAAGADYSLICVRTVKTRKQRNQKEAANLHQLYGFGSNKGRKLGLYKNTSETKMTLPHRIALHAKVSGPFESNGDTPALSTHHNTRDGIICLVASCNHSAALARSATGAVDLFMWGEPGAVGLASESGAITKVESLSYNPALDHDEDSYLEPSEYPTQVALGVNCTFVLLNTGRCLAFGGSHLLPEKVCLEPTEVKLEAHILSLSVGEQHVLATCMGNRVFGWGVDPATQITQARPRELACRAVQTFAGYDVSAFVLDDGTVQTCGVKSGRLGQGEVPPNSKKPAPLFGGLRLWR